MRSILQKIKSYFGINKKTTQRSLVETAHIEKILKELEKERNNSLKHLSDTDLVDLFLRMQINIFTSVYFLALVEFKDKTLEFADTYRIYFRARINAVRYLLELYLTFAHIMEANNRLSKVYSLNISQQINLFINDLDLDNRANQEQKPSTLKALVDRRAAYKSFVGTFKSTSHTMPSSVDDIINNARENGVISKAKLAKNAKAYGFEYFKHNIINFSEEIRNNANVDTKQRENILRAYDLLSLDVHPTVAGFTEFEQFIGSIPENKHKLILNKDELAISLLKVIGEHMLSLSRKLIAEKVTR